MTKAQKKALILGASGLTGSLCLKLLLESSAYSSVIALVRKKLDIQHPRLEQHIVNFDHTAAMQKFYDGVDDVFCCLGTTIKKAGSQSAFRRVDFHIPTEAANIAAEQHVKQFLAISSVGANNKSSNFYLRVKGEMEKGITQFSFDAIHIFRPSLLLGDRHEKRPGESIAKLFSNIFSPLMSSRSSKYKPISAQEVAQAMVNAAQLNNAGEHFYSTGQIYKLAKKEAIA